MDKESRFSRSKDDFRVTPITRDVGLNRKSFGLKDHVSPFDNEKIHIGVDNIHVRLLQDFNEADFRAVMSRSTRAPIGMDLGQEDEPNMEWEEMLRGGLQTALESAVVVFEVSGVSRVCTHQLVRSRRASFHQQSQRAIFMGRHPDTRMPESVWNNIPARTAFLEAMDAAHEAYQVAVDEDISYQDARFILPEGTITYIMCEYNLREFMNMYAYRACSMMMWEICHVVREMRRLLVEAHPWLNEYILITCEATSPNPLKRKCTFQGWESVEARCNFPWARDANRTFQPKFHTIKPKKSMEGDRG